MVKREEADGCFQESSQKEQLNKEGLEQVTREIWLVRHPESFFSRAAMANEGEPEDPVPISKMGLKQARLLADFLQKDLAERGIKDHEARMVSSPLRRAKNLAQIIAMRLHLAKTENPNIPHIDNPEELKVLTEVPSGFSKDEYLQIIEESEEKGVPLMRYWIGRQDRKELISNLEEKVKEVQ